MTEFAEAQEISKEPAFNWWVCQVLRKRERIIKLVKIWNARFLKRRYKCDIKVPMNMEEAIELDKANRNSL